MAAANSDRRKRRSMLKQYYGDEVEGQTVGGSDALDVDNPDFNSDLYLNKLLKEKNLAQLMEKEQQFYRQIQSLDSEMQTLVYENYNKFISATETVRKMSSNFDKMEDQLLLLTKNMDSITDCSEHISLNLKSRRQELSKLSNTHDVLKKLSFLFELAPRMQKSIEDGAYTDAVKCFLQAEKALDQYKHFPSIQAIDNECRVIVAALKKHLHDQFASGEASQQQMSESVKLLLQLQDEPQVLASEFLTFSSKRLEVGLNDLDYQTEMYSKFLGSIGSVKSGGNDIVSMDVLEYVEAACSGFLSNLCALIVSFDNLFLDTANHGYSSQMDSNTSHQQSDEERDHLKDLLSNFVNRLVDKFLVKISARLELERPVVNESSLLVRALDRFYRRLVKLRKIYPHGDFSKRALDIANAACKSQRKNTFEFLRDHFNTELTKLRQSLVGTGTLSHEQKKQNMSELLINLEMVISEQTKAAMASLLAFTQPEVTFVRENSGFELTFSRTVREDVIVKYLREVLAISLNYQKAGLNSAPPSQIVLLLAKLCLDFDSSVISYLLAFADEQFCVTGQHQLTSAATLCQEARETAQKLINFYVRLEGHQISEMVRKSVETRDWLGSVEPRSVRSVIKRVVDEVTQLDRQVGQLLEEGTRMERGSDSSRSWRALSALDAGSKTTKNSAWHNYSASNIDNNLMSNIQKLFYEKIEIFSPVEFTKLSVVTGIIKIGLKTLVECVRLCTFSKFGLQQIQVDAFYLQTHLWRFVSDENLLHTLLDEVLVSAVHRSLDPMVMEMNVVEKICEGL